MKKVLNIVGGVICGLICVILFIFQVAFLLITPAKSLITKDFIKQIINNVNVTDVISEDSETTSDIYGAFDSLGFSVEETQEILDSESFKEFLNTYVYENINSFIDDNEFHLDFGDLENLIDQIEKEKGITFKNKDEFLELAKEKYSDIESNIDLTNNINKNVSSETLDIIKFLASGTFTIIFIVIFVVIYAVMCLLRWSVYKPLIWYGITTILSSFIMIQVFLGLSLINITEYIKIEKVKPILEPALKTIKNKGLITSGIVLAVGILMVVIFFIINKKVKQNDPNNVDTQLENI